MRRYALVSLLLPTLLAGCFSTRFTSGAAPAGPVRDDGQWFTLWGAVPLSDPAAGECRDGIAWAHSELGVTDILVDVGLAVGGGIIGGVLCPLPDGPSAGEAREYGGCVSGFSTLVPMLLTRRTVRYQCAAPAAAEPGGRSRCSARVAAPW
ncbi:MAG: hypothetical protein U1F43_28700 [Myxococcota bacterium]